MTNARASGDSSLIDSLTRATASESGSERGNVRRAIGQTSVRDRQAATFGAARCGLTVPYYECPRRWRSEPGMKRCFERDHLSKRTFGDMKGGQQPDASAF